MKPQKKTRREFLAMSATGIAGIVLAGYAPTITLVAASAPTFAASQTAATPTTFKESPSLAALVKAGKLPPVEQRLPTVPLILSPVGGVGKYGGRLRSYWPGTSWNGHWQQSQYGHSPLRWIDDGLGVAPGMCDTWSANANNSEWTLHIRAGLKWSDGHACTADDILFWWEDLTQATNPAYPDGVPDFGQDANGKLATFTKVDDYTLKITYGAPSPLTAKRLAMWVNANIGPRWIAPKHYLSQFHPKYNTTMSNFSLFNQKSVTYTNPDLPTLNSWILTRYEAGKSMTAERNPYYYAVDPVGNQLPYIDGTDWVAAANRTVELSLISQGLVDHSHFNNFTIGDIATLIGTQNAGNYDVYLWDSGSGTGMMYFWNFDTADSKLRALYRTPKFKQAMSFALNRSTIQNTVYFGTGMLTTGTMSPKAFEFNFNAEAQAFGKKAFEIYAAYDPAKANALLDEIGCTVGADSKRTYPDGSKLEVHIGIQSDANNECKNVLEIARKNWEAVGLNIIVDWITPSDFDVMWQSGNLTCRTNWEVGDGPDHLLYPSWAVPNERTRWAPLCGGVLLYAGTPYETTETGISPWSRNPPRFNKNDVDYKDTPVEQIHQIYAKAIIEPDEIKRAQYVWQIWQIHMDQGPFFIGTVANYPKPKIVSRRLKGVPKHEELKLGGFDNPWIIPYPAVTNPETWSFKPAIYMPIVQSKK